MRHSVRTLLSQITAMMYSQSMCWLREVMMKMSIFFTICYYIKRQIITSLYIPKFTRAQGSISNFFFLASHTFKCFIAASN